MNLLYIDPQSYSNLALYDYNLLNGMQQSRIVFCGSILYDQPIPDHVEFKPVFVYNKKKNNIAKLLSYVCSLFQIALVVRKYKPEVVHIQWLRVWAVDYLFMKWLQAKRCKVIFTAHNVLPHNSGKRYKKKYQQYYTAVNGIIVHTHRSKEELITDFALRPSKISVIPHGVLAFPIAEEEIIQRVAELRKRGDSNPEGIITFSLLGQQSYYKGADLVVQAWKELTELHDADKYKLLMIGKNEQVDCSAIASLANVVIKNEFVSALDFQAYLAMTDVLLMPYRQISQSGVLLTAIHARTPFLVSDQGGLTEPLEIANVGWNLGSESSVEALKNILQEIITHPTAILQRKQNLLGWEKLHNFYNWQQIAKQTELLYSKCGVLK